MSMMTQTQTILVFRHVVKNFLNASAESPMQLAFDHHGISDLLDLLPFPVDDVDSFKYVPTPDPKTFSGPLQPLSSGHKNIVKLFIRWSQKLFTENDNIPLTEEEWMLLKVIDFSIFHLTGNVFVSSSTGGTPSSGTNIGVASTIRASTAAADFKKSIKRDQSSYPHLKDQKNWNSWKGAVRASKSLV